ncbi:MAG TPA: hypothetical protein DDZ67_10380 [Xanthomonadaceae bacterium]|nr:hypothetical protein [Xanthomonadaceae bacterium]
MAVSPLLWLALTLGCFLFGKAAQRLCGGSPLVNPVLVAILAMVLLLKATGTSYDAYFNGAQFINFLLGPATVALAVPLARNIGHIRGSLREIGLALLAGSLTSTLSGVLLVWLFGGARDVAMSMAAKSVTTPIAIAVSQEVGGVPALTAALAIAGGIVLFLIGIRMIFPRPEGLMGEIPDGEPFIVPLAIPLVAGPSGMAAVMLMGSNEPARLGEWSLALMIAWGAAAAILFSSPLLYRLLGHRALTALERLMGMLLVAISVQMFLDGIGTYLKLPVNI